MAVLVGVAVVVGAFRIWSATRARPPYEAWSTPLPRATIPPAGTSTALADAAAPAPAPLDVSDEGAPHQRWSWSLAAMGSLDAAHALSVELQRSAPDQAFMVAPIVSGGRTLYRVLGGLATDRTELVAMREALARETGLASGTWLVREAPLAFALQEFDAAEDAARRVEELWSISVPAYVLLVERDDGSRIHRVYAGAYASEEEALPLRRLLEDAAISPETLSERKGRIGA